MAKYVVGPDVALRLAHGGAVIPDEHQLLAPTLFRSQVLSLLYRAVRQGDMTKWEADRQLTYLRALRMRLLGDRVLQDVAWKIADQLGWSDTLDAEYVALTQLQADAFITLDRELARAVTGLVTVGSIEALGARPPAGGRTRRAASPDAARRSFRSSRGQLPAGWSRSQGTDPV